MPAIQEIARARSGQFARSDSHSAPDRILGPAVNMLQRPLAPHTRIGITT
jgi:hypothetical protein